MNPLRSSFAFMKRHEKSCLISGFLVLFITFVVRDILLDRARTLADVLSAAETAYLLEDANVQLHHEIDVIDGHVVLGDSDILASSPHYRKQFHIDRDLESMLDRTSLQYLRMDSETNTEFASLYRLLEVLPSDNAHRSDFSKLYARWDKDQVNLLRPIPLIGAKVDPVVARADADEDRKHRQDMWVINGQLPLLGASILDDAQRSLEVKEHQASIFAWWSYALYFIGWILAFGSKIAGIETIGI